MKNKKNVIGNSTGCIIMLYCIVGIRISCVQFYQSCDIDDMLLIVDSRLWFSSYSDHLNL
jgi:hypothetical protein